jgi:lysozyme
VPDPAWYYYYVKAITSSILFILVIATLFYFRLVWFVYPDRNMYPVRGIDISHHQSTIDWDSVAHDDVSFAFIKASEADDIQDALFNENITKAKQAGIKVGAYHFYSLGVDGEIQAQNYINAVATNSVQLPPVIDLEYGGNSKLRPTKDEFQKELKIYSGLVSNHFGSKPILYTTNEFYNEYLYPEYKDSNIWIRSVFSKPGKDMSNWIFWQYNPRGRIKGIKGAVDLNVFKGSKEEFNNFKGL